MIPFKKITGEESQCLRRCHSSRRFQCLCVRFGLPFVLHLEKTVAWDLLQKEILEKMKYFLRPTVCVQVRMLTRRPARPGKEQPLQGALRLRPVRWGPGPEPPRGKLSLVSLRAELQDRGRSPRCAKGAGRCRCPSCLSSNV